MSYITTLLASLDTRLDELATEISTLEGARVALRTRTLAAPPTKVAQNGAARKRPRRTPQTTTPAPKPRPSATDPKPELAATAVRDSRPEASTPRQRAAARATQRKRSGSLLSAEQLEGLLADATSGLSAGAIAERAGVGYGRVLASRPSSRPPGRFRRSGSRRSTLWLLSTDEDWVAQRAAELERLVGARRDDRSQRRGRPGLRKFDSRPACGLARSWQAPAPRGPSVWAKPIALRASRVAQSRIGTNAMSPERSSKARARDCESDRGATLLDCWSAPTRAAKTSTID